MIWSSMSDSSQIILLWSFSHILPPDEISTKGKRKVKKKKKRKRKRKRKERKRKRKRKRMKMRRVRKMKVSSMMRMNVKRNLESQPTTLPLNQFSKLNELSSSVFFTYKNLISICPAMTHCSILPTIFSLLEIVYSC